MVKPVNAGYQTIEIPAKESRVQSSAPIHLKFKTTINMPPQDRTAAILDAFRRCVISSAAAVCVGIVVAKRVIDTSGVLQLLNRVADIARE